MLYVIECDHDRARDLIRVGITSREQARRLKEHTSNAPFELHYLGRWALGDVEVYLESQIQSILKPYQFRNDWFSVPVKIKEFFTGLVWSHSTLEKLRRLVNSTLSTGCSIKGELK